MCQGANHLFDRYIILHNTFIYLLIYHLFILFLTFLFPFITTLLVLEILLNN